MNELTVGRTPITLVQIDQDICTRTYGVAPCTANTPTNKCYNTRKTCQDTANYEKSSLTLTFGKPESDLPRDMNIIPMLTSVTTAPNKINPNAGNRNSSPLGQRAVATIRMLDAPYSDLLTDPYRDGRGFNPLERSTFWSKWLARNLYYQNRPLRIYEGYLGQTLAEMKVRHYLIDTISGPDSNGVVSIVAKDPLKLADKDKAQVPFISYGELLQDITDTDTTIIAKRCFASEYPTTGTLRIGDELLTYTSRVQSTLPDTTIIVTFSGITRGTDGSEVSDHKANSTVQNCLRYSEKPLWEVVYELLTVYAKVPTTYIPYDDWIAEGEEWLGQYNVTTILSVPMGVNDALGELLEQFPFNIWWDERVNLIKLQAIRFFTGDYPTLSQNSNIIENTFSITSDSKNRNSQIWVFHSPRNWAKTEASNYQQIEIRADVELESPELYDESKIKKIYSRWLSNGAQAVDLSARMLRTSFDNPTYIKLRCDAKDRYLWTADIAYIQHRSLVGFDGDLIVEKYQIISAQEIISGETIEFELQKLITLAIKKGYYMDVGAPDYADATPTEKENGCFFADENGLLPDGSDGYQYE